MNNNDSIIRDTNGYPIKYGMWACEIDPKTGELTVAYEDYFILTKENSKNLL